MVILSKLQAPRAGDLCQPVPMEDIQTPGSRCPVLLPVAHLWAEEVAAAALGAGSCLGTAAPVPRQLCAAPSHRWPLSPALTLTWHLLIHEHLQCLLPQSCCDTQGRRCLLRDVLTVQHTSPVLTF